MSDRGLNGPVDRSFTATMASGGFFAEWTDAYEEWTLEVERITDAGESHVVVAARQRGRLRGSDSWVALRAWLLYTVESGLLVRAEVYATPEEALEAAGLEK
jgi:hypothetical protein